MGEALRQRIKQTRFQSPLQEAILNLIVAGNYIRERGERAVSEFEITLPQYNVLRILRGVHPSGHPRCEIAARMLDRAPDVTRIIDRLEEKSLVERDRTGTDRRHSITRITEQGLELLERMQPVMDEPFADLRERLSLRDCKELSRICELIYGTGE
jgi:DNA-binding MarR family transcriptional regulator